jgi:hypothetical protein
MFLIDNYLRTEILEGRLTHLPKFAVENCQNQLVLSPRAE